MSQVATKIDIGKPRRPINKLMLVITSDYPASNEGGISAQAPLPPTPPAHEKIATNDSCLLCVAVRPDSFEQQ